MRRLADPLARAVSLLSALLLAALVVIATAETLAWTLFEVSSAAVGEIEGILLVWFGLLAAAWGIHQRIHLGVEVLTRRLPTAVGSLLGRVAAALVALFGGLVAVHAAELTGRITNTLPATGLEASVQYFPALVGGLLITFFALIEVIAGPDAGERSPKSEER